MDEIISQNNEIIVQNKAGKVKQAIKEFGEVLIGILSFGVMGLVVKCFETHWWAYASTLIPVATVYLLATKSAVKQEKPKVTVTPKFVTFEWENRTCAIKCDSISEATFNHQHADGNNCLELTAKMGDCYEVETGCALLPLFAANLGDSMKTIRIEGIHLSAKDGERLTNLIKYAVYPA